jgi:hypothetical protein
MTAHPTPKRRGILGLSGDPLSTLLENGGFSPGILGRNDLFSPDFGARPFRPPSPLRVGDSHEEETAPAYRETWQTHVKVLLVGHASPRWKSAKSAEEADKKNLELSQKRVHSVRQAVERIIRFKLKDHKLTFSFDESQAPEEHPGEVSIGTLAKGSQEALVESGGDRSAVGKHFQRVDIRVDLTHLIAGEAPSQEIRLAYESPATRDWALNLGVSGDLHFGFGMSITHILLKNLKTKRCANGTIVGYGGGASVFDILKSLKMLKAWKSQLRAADKAFSAGVAYSFGGWQKFRTDTPKRCYDFDGALIRLTTLGLSLFIGASVTKLTIYGFGSDAESMDHSGLEVGKLKAGGYIDLGYIDLQMLPKIDDDIVKRQVVDKWEPYRTQMPSHSFHYVEFELSDHQISQSELKKLTTALEQVCQNYIAS